MIVFHSNCLYLVSLYLPLNWELTHWTANDFDESFSLTYSTAASQKSKSLDF